MLKTYNYKELSKADIKELVSRNADESNTIGERVESIISAVRSKGDAALIEFAEQFDKVKLNRLYLNKEEISQIASAIGEEQKLAIETAYQNIYKFHQSQLKTEDKVETMPGVTCWREVRAIEKVGLYIPGGTAVLPSTFLMLGIPAKIAGSKEIVVCSPPQKDGSIN